MWWYILLKGECIRNFTEVLINKSLRKLVNFSSSILLDYLKSVRRVSKNECIDAYACLYNLFNCFNEYYVTYITVNFTMLCFYNIESIDFIFFLLCYINRPLDHNFYHYSDYCGLINIYENISCEFGENHSFYDT